MKPPLRIAVTLGDLNGIGPEVTLKALRRLGRVPGVQFVLVGAPAALTPHLGRGAPLPRGLLLWDPVPHLAPRYRPGRVAADAARAAAAWIVFAARGCQAGLFDALVTAPISKAGFQRAGLHFPGHTELLAALTGARRFAMLLMGGPLRVVLVTRHLPLAQVPAALTRTNIAEAIRLTDDGLRWLGVRRRRIAVCGLNPHAGDGGLLGREEVELIAPAIRAARRNGMTLTGPVPADVVFYQAVHGRHDAVVAMYHDQGLGPLKMLAFDTGVNLTLGLPIIRTLPDHGTAYDIAGQDRANPASMVAALQWAIRLARRPNPWKKKK
ncbi:MAG: 4-hydroxythreonine-4-phosphate dehydrogenase PdxA [Kiritimatiellaeota bacterium]|nr:4-hydroxythreonine-4-phosphate dehydrogenase PdxA [Kiritimatiellota bacterium]